MTAAGLAVFDTAIGACALTWGGRGVTGVQLPAGDRARTRARALRRAPGTRETAPPAEIDAAIAAITALLGGVPTDLRGVPVDLERLPAFDRRVYAAAREIGPGATVTYGELARRIGAPQAAQAVGGALGRNPVPIVVPCHRVLAAGGALGGFSAPGGAATKRRLLAIEGAIAEQPALF